MCLTWRPEALGIYIAQVLTRFENRVIDQFPRVTSFNSHLLLFDYCHKLPTRRSLVCVFSWEYVGSH